jgi:hypothetical protein
MRGADGLSIAAFLATAAGPGAPAADRASGSDYDVLELLLHFLTIGRSRIELHCKKVKPVLMIGFRRRVAT